MLTPTHLTAGDVRKIEEALNTDDLETMVAVVHRIVALRLRAAISPCDDSRIRPPKTF